jgi:exopolysaccharide biosynthesis predicted pyruvyltransferase EpsI
MDSFEEHLAQHRDETMAVITPGGNHGDTLIHMGLVKKLVEYGIQYGCINLEQMYGKDLILGAKYLVNIALWRLGSSLGLRLLRLPEETEHIMFEGGGYMNDIWFGPALLRQVMKRNKQPVTVAPQSYLFTRTRFDQYFTDDRSVYLFCREEYSYEHLRKNGLPENVRINSSPELALYLSKDDLSEYIELREGDYELLAFRVDKESALSPSAKNELMEICENPLVSDVSMKGTMTDFVSTVHNAEKIYTDRLHVAILSMILGKNATLFGNKYHKNRGVWELSLKDHIEYIETEP